MTKCWRMAAPDPLLPIREKTANADFSIPEEVLARLKMGQETVE